MSIPVLSAADPVTIPATVYDKVWVEEVVISAPDPNGEVTARVRLRRFAAVEGRAELEPAAGQWLEVRDVLTGADTDPDLGNVVSALMLYVAKLGRERGVVMPATP